MANRNRSSLRGEVYLRLAESGSGFYTDAEINQWLNDGVRDIAVNIEPSITTATTATTTDVAEYALPSDTLSVRKVLFLDANDAWVELTPTTWEQLFEDDADWENDPSAFPEQWYWRQDIVGVTPAPSATYSGADTLRILYTYIPAAMDDDSATSGLPEWLDDAVILFAVGKGYQKDRSFDKANAIAQEYSRAVSEGALKVNRHRKQHAPRLVPDMGPYRTYYMRRGRGGIIRVADS